MKTNIFWVNQKFYNILARTSVQRVCLMTKAVQPVVGIIGVVGALRLCTLLHFVCNLKATYMNVQRSLFQEFQFSEIELGDNATEKTKKVCYTKSEGVIASRNFAQLFGKVRYA